MPITLQVSFFWELNVTFIGTTQAIHEKNLKSTKGLNKLYITDENGNVTKTQFSVI
ncbi:hypothetical protein N9F53_01365 [Bacteroidia bacterium]|jgi:hypothetical protein|nr:hypothetical protein [Bacteroidia bacterium]